MNDPGLPRDGRAVDPRLIAATAVLIAYFLTRAPFYSQPIVGEEGIFACLITQALPGPDFGLMGRVNGQVILEPLQHPAGMYVLLAKAGWLMRRLLELVAPENLQGTAWIRMLNSAFQGLFCLSLAWVFGALRGRSGWMLIAWAAVFLTMPLAIGSSVYLQTDTTSGILLCGLAALALAQTLPGRPLIWPALACFALGALGKQEWSLALLAALGGFAVLPDGWVHERPRWQWPLGLLAGAVVLGNLLSLAYDPVNYLGGLRVLGFAGQRHALSSVASAPWAEMLKVRAPFVGSLLLGLAALPALLASLPIERRAGLMLATLLSLALFVPFLLSTWSAEFRYFAPSWAACFATGCAVVAASEFRRHLRWLALAGLLCAVQLAFVGQQWWGRRSMTEAVLSPLASQEAWFERVDLLIKGKSCVPMMPAAWGWDRPGQDFIVSSNSLDYAVEKLKPHGKALCQ